MGPSFSPHTPHVRHPPDTFQPPYFPPPFSSAATGSGQPSAPDMFSVHSQHDPYPGSLHCFQSSSQVRLPS